LNRWDRGQITIPHIGSANGNKSLNELHPQSLFQDNHGRVWISTSRELGYLEHDRFVPVRKIADAQILSIVQDTANTIWVINEPVGLLGISPQNHVIQIPWSALGHEDHASVLAADRGRGGLWIGFFLGGISYFSGGQIRTSYTTADGLGTGRISEFQLDDDGALWISTEGGLSRLKNNHLATLSSKNGLPCDTVHWSIEDNDHSMWLYTACGLVRIARSELDAWAAAVDKGQGTTRAIQVTVFDSSDGVGIISEPDHYHPGVAKTPEGKVWFIPVDGVSVIDPHLLSFNKIPPPVHIEKVSADDKQYDLSSGVRLPSGVRNLTIDYTALSLVVPEKVHFRYKLEGQDKDWREVVNDREVQYTNLPPKHYKFRVIACNNSGVWNEEGASLDFVIPPAWYQTNWFRAACVAAFLAMIWGIHELRVRQLAHEFNMGLEQRVAERTRVARDLHDTLLQSFQALLPSLQAGINMLATRPADARKVLEATADHASQAIAEGRDAVQGLRMSTVEKNDLAVAIRTIGEELAFAASIQPSPNFNVVVEGASRSLHPILRDEVYRLVVEALRNAFRHAAAQNVEVEIRYDEKYFRLRVRDDGKGIPSDVLSGDGREGHYGLPGMRERAKLVGGKLAIWTELDGGTEIEINIPGARAYVKSTRTFWHFGKRSATDTDEKEPIERE
jgi:signal transduction histidine kinase